MPHYEPRPKDVARMLELDVALRAKLPGTGGDLEPCEESAGVLFAVAADIQRSE